MTSSEQGRIRMTIDALGRPKIEAEGFVGASCTEATAGIEKALSGGAGKTVTVLKSEYYETETQQEVQHQTW